MIENKFGKMTCKHAGQGQSTVEYVVMFTVIVAVILYASTGFVRPAMNRFFNQAANMIDRVSNTFNMIY